MNNMFLNALEQTFDEYFNSISPSLVVNDPKYLQAYREELANFCKFLVEEYDAARSNDSLFNNND